LPTAIYPNAQSHFDGFIRQGFTGGVARNGLVVHGAGHIYILRRSNDAEACKENQGKEKRFHVVVLIDD
jgi:hypothetical protein